ncbi:MAG: primosomal protein N' [Clostridia bacterium]|nr:primosomal protein N' [Clostridia bacterium]
MIYEVIVDISNSEVDKVFDYISPFPVNIGDRVLVPFGKRQIEGYIIGQKEKSDGSYDLKDIIMKLDDFTAITPEMLELTKYMSSMNLRKVDCLRQFIPTSIRNGKTKILKRSYLKISDKVGTLDQALDLLNRGAKSQITLVKRLFVNGNEQERDINKDFSATTIKSLVEKGVLERIYYEENRTPKSLDIENKKIELTLEQQNALNEILGPEKSFLIHGVTGSGKTELYMRVIEDSLKKGKNAIMLVPEISLTPQMLGVFRARFGEQVSLLHSNLSPGERFDEWRKLRNGYSRIALGPRSAIFAPLENLGVIIIDEEHDSSYVSESNPRYFTSEIAAFRAKYNNCKLLLGSATPSIETYYRASIGEYRLIAMNNRINNRCLPEIETIDMRREMKAGNTSIFSAKLLSAVEDSLKRKEQVMIFLNRRGYSSFVRCQECGFIPMCPSCDVSLTFHSEDNSLRCHFCGNKYRMIDECPNCGNKDLKEGRIGTEKVVKELTRIFPENKVLRMDLDSTSQKDSYIKILNSFNSGEADILVGTQMIAKGHDFKNVTLVGILDADISLFIQDFRANERTFQLITQVAGRAGRDCKPGKVLMQTYVPSNAVFAFTARYDYKGFYDREIEKRKGTLFPPFSKIVRILTQAKDGVLSQKANHKLYDLISGALRGKEGIIRIQEMPAAMKKKSDYYRYQVVIWVRNEFSQNILEIIYDISNSFHEKGVTVFSEINPQQMI